MPISGLLAVPNYYYSINQFSGNGSQVNWEISFAGGYISRAHVKTIQTDLSGNTSVPVFTWVSDNTINVTPPVPAGHTLTVYRDTPKTAPIANFNDGAVINETNLDQNAAQAVFIAAEALDRGEGALAELAPRALMVPVGEVSPGLPARSTLVGKVLAVGLDGKFYGASFSTSGGIPAASSITYGAGSVSSQLDTLVTGASSTTAELAAQALTLTDHGLSLVAQASSISTVSGNLAVLRADFEALSDVVDSLTTFGGGQGLATLIANETTARTNADTAMAATIAFIGATNGEGTAFDLNLATVKVGPTETLGQRLSALSTADSNALALITAEETARITAVSAEAAQRTTLAATLRDETAAAVLAESNSRATAISAEATARTALAATLRTETAAGDAAEAAGRSAAITSAINSEAATRAAGDAAEATARTTLAATLRAETTAAVLAESNARAAADSAEATTREALGVTLGASISAQVATETTARVAADDALSATVTSLSTTVDGHTSSINTQAASISGIQAKYSVTLSVDGHVSGFSLIGGGGASDFLVKADTFKVAMPGVTPRVVFGVDATGVRISGDLYMGTGRIISDTGAFMKVAGIGFGTSNQFIEWFGPKMAINLCSEANAKSYIKTNGDAYYGGSLSAGVLKNAYQTSDLSSTALLETATYGSNGGQISVVVSYFWTAYTEVYYAATSAGVTQYNTDVAAYGGSGSPGSFTGSVAESGTTTVALDRSVADGAYASVTTLTVTGGTRTMSGTRPTPGDSAGYATFTQTFSGSLTYADPAYSTNNRKYRATITGRTFSALGMGQQQRVAIISTE